MSIERIEIKDRLRWLELRRHDVTASAISALFGVSEYQTAFGLYLVKARLIEEESDDPIITEDEISLSPMGRGLLLEEPAEKMLRLLKPDWEIEKNKFYYRDAELRIGATPDLIVRDPKRGPGVVQVKNPQASYRKWMREDGSIEPPLDYVIQTVLEAHLTGATWAAVGAFVVSHRTTLRLISIPIHAGILDRIKGLVAEFWQRVAEKRAYPPDYGRDGALIAKLYPEDDGSEIDLSADNEAPLLIDQLAAARAAKKVAEGEEETAKSGIAAKMGAAAVARFADGRRVSNKVVKKVLKPRMEAKTVEYRMMKILAG